MHGWSLLKRIITIIIIIIVVVVVVVAVVVILLCLLQFENSLTWSIAPAQNLP